MQTSFCSRNGNGQRDGICWCLKGFWLICLYYLTQKRSNKVRNPWQQKYISWLPKKSRQVSPEVTISYNFHYEIGDTNTNKYEGERLCVQWAFCFNWNTLFIHYLQHQVIFKLHLASLHLFLPRTSLLKLQNKVTEHKKISKPF